MHRSLDGDEDQGTDALTVERGSEGRPEVLRADLHAIRVIPQPSVPSLFRQTLISTTKRCEPARSEIPAQRHDRRYCDRPQKFELYYDV